MDAYMCGSEVWLGTAVGRIHTSVGPACASSAQYGVCAVFSFWPPMPNETKPRWLDCKSVGVGVSEVEGCGRRFSDLVLFTVVILSYYA